MSNDFKELEKEMNKLGIISIEADGELTPDLAKDAIQAVKKVDLNFAEISKKIDKNRRTFAK